jgi:hypothetical protein
MDVYLSPFSLFCYAIKIHYSKFLRNSFPHNKFRTGKNYGGWPICVVWHVTACHYIVMAMGFIIGVRFLARILKASPSEPYPKRFWIPPNLPIKENTRSPRSVELRIIRMGPCTAYVVGDNNLNLFNRVVRIYVRTRHTLIRSTHIIHNCDGDGFSVTSVTNGVRECGRSKTSSLHISHVSKYACLK